MANYNPVLVAYCLAVACVDSELVPVSGAFSCLLGLLCLRVGIWGWWWFVFGVVFFFCHANYPLIYQAALDSSLVPWLVNGGWMNLWRIILVLSFLLALLFAGLDSKFVIKWSLILQVFACCNNVCWIVWLPNSSCECRWGNGMWTRWVKY